MTDFIDEMFSDHELVRAFNGSGIQTTTVPDSAMAVGCRVVARYAIAKYLAGQTPALERIADSLESTDKVLRRIDQTIGHSAGAR